MQGTHIMLVIIITCSLEVLLVLLRRFHCRRELGLLAKLLPKEVETDGDWHANRGKTAKKCSGPLDAKIVEHLASKQWEASCGKRSEKGVCCDSRGSANSIVSYSHRKDTGM